MAQKIRSSNSLNGQLVANWQKWDIFDMTTKWKVIFFVTKLPLVLWLKWKHSTFSWKWVFGSFLAIWSDILWLGQKTKKDFFSHKNRFLFSERPVFVCRKMSCSSNPKLVWNILILRPTAWLFWMPRGFPFAFR